MPTPEQEARQQIDKQLEAAGWVIQDRDAIDLSAGRGVAVLVPVPEIGSCTCFCPEIVSDIGFLSSGFGLRTSNIACRFSLLAFRQPGQE